MAAKKATTATVNQEMEPIVIQPIERKIFSVTIVGDTPLIIHKFSTKAKIEMLEKQMKQTKTKARDAKDPFSDFVGSLYFISGSPETDEHGNFIRKGEALKEEFEELVLSKQARFGFPVTAFKQAANSAVYRAGIVKNQMQMRGSFFIQGIDTPDGQMVEIQGMPEMFESHVRIQGSADIRYRAIFNEWKATMTVLMNANGAVSADAIVNALNMGGFMCGVGEWRPEKDGQYGMYHITAMEG